MSRSEQQQSHPIPGTPAHIAIIMDGNGRWAQQRGLTRTEGHRAAIKAIRSTIRRSSDLGLRWLSLFAFSTENVQRPQREVEGIFQLFDECLDREVPELQALNVRIVVSGDIALLPEKLERKFADAVRTTAANTGLTVNFCVMYSGRHEVVRAAQKLAEAVRGGELKPEEVAPERLVSAFYHPEMPDPDLLIRTGGELRVSNFMLWQLAYAELYFTPTLWPDFSGDELERAITDYRGRERRFGRV